MNRDRDAEGRPRNARNRDDLGRPLPKGAPGHPPYDEPPLPPVESLRRAQALLDAGRPFTAHEVLEAVWKAPTTGQSDRPFWQGLAQLAVGVTHAARGNPRGATTLWQRAVRNLGSKAGSRPFGVDVDVLIEWARHAALAPERAEPLPRLLAPAESELGGEGA